MANQLTLPVVPDTLPSGFCPQGWQAILNGFSAAQHVTFPDTFTGISVSAAKPSDSSKAWLQLDSLGRPVRLYWFAQGAWLSQHVLFPGFITIWLGALPTFTTFDGGDANPVSAISGPMWELVTELAGKFPLGSGTLPSTTVVNIGNTGGNDQHTNTTQELAKHTHGFRAGTQGDSGNVEGFGSTRLVGFGATNDAVKDIQAGDVSQFSSPNKAYPIFENGATLPYSIMNPYLAVSFIRRTQRLFYTVT